MSLDGIVPSKLHITVKNATVQIHNLYTSQSRLLTTKGILKSETDIRKDQIGDIVDCINAYNKSHGKLWRAGVTDASLVRYESRGDFVGTDDVYLSNLKYYADGVYDIGETDEASTVMSTTSYVSDFDWRYMHGRNILTPAKNQGNSGYCTAFAIASTLEARANLYYNKVQLYPGQYVDLSEQDIVYDYARAGYKNISDIYSTGMDIGGAYEVVKSYGVLDEASVPFIDAKQSTIPSRPIGNECLQISSYAYKNGYSESNAEAFKGVLINNGPATVSFGTATNWHAVTLAGYHTIKEGDTISQIKIPSEGGLFAPIVVPANSPFIGKTYWVVKDNYGLDAEGRHEGYMYLYFKSYSRLGDLYYTESPIVMRNLTDDDIVIEDLDGDGYFNWGIGPRPDDRLPAWAEQEEDGDDSKKLKGPMDQYGFISDLSYSEPVYVVDHDMTDTELAESIGGRFIRRHIRINPGVTLTVTGALCLHSTKSIYMYSNSVLHINGGSFTDLGMIKSGNGSLLKIDNGGQILHYKRNEFSLPVGILLDMGESEIK